MTYSLPALATSVAALPLALLVPAFYADDLGMPLAAVGMAIALAALLDLRILFKSIRRRIVREWGDYSPFPSTD